MRISNWRRRGAAVMMACALSTGLVAVSTPASAGATPAAGYLHENQLTRFIVVLGARLNPDNTAPEILKSRMDRAASLAKTYPLTRLVVSGGDTGGGSIPMTEAGYMHAMLTLDHGIAPWRIAQEPNSASTVGNAQYTVALLRRLGAEGAVIVTQGWHMDRALANFRAQPGGLTFVPAYAL